MLVSVSIDLAQSMDTTSELIQPRIVIRKKERILEVFDGESSVRSYKIALGVAPIGDKEVEGDGKTPEGDFYVFAKNPESRFHRSLGLSYPSKTDAKRGFKANLITKEEFDSINIAIDEGGMPLQKTKLGGEIYIHGGGTERDWTDGCIALKNKEMTELFGIVPAGTKVTILP
jgi:murein L,D-transpeptidase YafK